MHFFISCAFPWVLTCLLLRFYAPAFVLNLHLCVGVVRPALAGRSFDVARRPSVEPSVATVSKGRVCTDSRPLDTAINDYYRIVVVVVSAAYSFAWC